jgi:hypothetical protein
MSGSTKTGRKYSFRMVLSFSCDPSNRVHELNGTIELDSGETIENARDQIIAQYANKDRRLRGADVFVVSFNYR